MKDKILIDAHIHTSGISKCSRVPAERLTVLCKNIGLDGIVLTNHYKRSCVDRDFAEWRNKYVDEYELTKSLGKEIGLKVFFGVEFTLDCMPENDFTVYGLPEEFIRTSEPVFELGFTEFIDLMHKQNALVYHAHPYRNTIPVDCTVIDGVEINCHPLYGTNERERVTALADKYDLRISCGSDYHGDTYQQFCGVWVDESVSTTDEFVEFIREHKRPELLIADIK